MYKVVYVNLDFFLSLLRHEVCTFLLQFDNFKGTKQIFLQLAPLRLLLSDVLLEDNLSDLKIVFLASVLFMLLFEHCPASEGQRRAPPH